MNGFGYDSASQFFGESAFDSNGLLTATLGKNLQSLGTDALGTTFQKPWHFHYQYSGYIV